MNKSGQPFKRSTKGLTTLNEFLQAEKLERLTRAAIIRDGVTHANGRSHYEVRYHLGDDSPNTSNPTDVEGFMTDTGRFVDREEAKVVGEASGQTRPQRRPLLSSDIRW